MSRAYPTLRQLQLALTAGGVRVPVAELEARLEYAERNDNRRVVRVRDVGMIVAIVDAEVQALHLPVCPIGRGTSMAAPVESEPEHPAPAPDLPRPQVSAAVLERDLAIQHGAERAAPVARSPESQARLTAAFATLKRRKHSAEARAKMSRAAKGKKRGPHSAATKAKIAAAHRGKKRSAQRKAASFVVETTTKIIE